MPGFLYHLACADIVAGCPTVLLGEGDYERLLAGSLAPDLVTDKNFSHFRQRDEESGWLIPNLELAYEKLGPLMFEDPQVLGVYCHLVLDQVFVKEVIGRKYKLAGEVVFSRRDYTTWRLDDFLSKEYGIYADYSAYNMRLIADKLVPTTKMFTLKESSPNQIIESLGWERNGQNWRKDIEGYLAEPVDKPQGFFTYLEIVEAILQAANQTIYDYARAAPSQNKHAE